MTRARTFMRASAVVLAATAALAACAVVPTLPDSLPDGWVPSVSPSALDPALVDSPIGFTNAERAAVRIRNLGCEEWATGSGFILDDHTIITNHHVVDDQAALEVTLSDGTDIAVQGSAYSTVADLGVITTVEALPVHVTLAASDPKVGDAVYTVGYPLGEELETRTSTILSVTDDTLDNAEYVFETGNLGSPGSSGSAVYNVDGEVVGVFYAGTEEDDYGYFIPVEILQKMLDDETLKQENPAACTL